MSLKIFLLCFLFSLSSSLTSFAQSHSCRIKNKNKLILVDPCFVKRASFKHYKKAYDKLNSPNLNMVDKKSGNSVLMTALRYSKDFQVISWLLDKNVSLIKPNKKKQTPLMHGARYLSKWSDFEVLVNKLGSRLKKEIEKKDFAKRTPLIFAIYGNQKLYFIKSLINLDAKVKVKDRSRRTPLMYAVLYNTRFNVIEYLIKNSPLINATDSFQKTALIHASEKVADERVIKLLLDYGAKTQYKDKTGKTAKDYLRKNPALSENLL